MHELSIIQSMLDIAFEQAKNQGASHIYQLNLRIGAIAGVIPEALEFAFTACRAGTIAADAKLEIEWIEARCYCLSCHAEFTPKDWIYICPQCDRLSHQIQQGRELELVSLEVC